jgi:hypothetical protein
MLAITDHQERLLWYLLLFIFFSGLWIFHMTSGSSGLLACLACVFYLMLGMTFWRNDFHALMLIFPFYFGYLGAVISSAYLEHGAYISEQEAFSHATGGTLRLVSYLVIFLGAAVAIVNLRPVNTHSLKQKPAAGSSPLRGTWVVLTLVCFYLFILCLGLMFYGSPLVMGITRFEYWAQHPNPLLWKLQIQLAQFAFLLGGLHALNIVWCYSALEYFVWG